MTSIYIIAQVLLYIQYLVITYNRKESEKVLYIYMYIKLNHFTVHQKLIQHWKSTIIKICFSLKN